MSRKRRAPIDQLRAAGRIADKMLRDKGILAQESVIDKIVADKKAPLLPGIPHYLPHEWTLKAAQRIMRDLVVIWVEKTANNKHRRDNITEFWKFVVKELKAQEQVFTREEAAMLENVKQMDTKVEKVPVLGEIFSPMRKKQNVQAIRHFLVDSFAVAVVLKEKHSVGDFLNWFLDWTQDLHELWVKPKDRDKVKRV